MAKKKKHSKRKKESKKKYKGAVTPKVSNKEAIDDIVNLFEEFLVDDDAATEASASKESPIPNSPILACPQFQKLADTLLSKQWLLDTRALDRNILHFSKDGERYILYLFYGDGESNYWLADELTFNEESPLWISPTTHLVSPVHAVWKYKETLDLEKASFHYPFVIIMHPNYIVNADDIVDEWGDAILVSLDRFCEIIDGGVELDCIETDVDDIDEVPDMSKIYKKRSSKIPIEYYNHIDEQLSWCKVDNVDTPKEVIVSKEKEADTEEHEEIEIKRVRFGTDLMSNSKLMASPSLATNFRSEADVFLLMWLDIEGNIPPRTQYLFELRDTKDNLIVSDTASLYSIQDMLMCLSIETALVGNYWIRIKNGNNELYCEMITFVELDKDYKKYLSLEAFGLYRIDGGDDEADYATMINRNAMSCYNYDNLAGVLVTSIYKNTSGRELPYQFVYSVENEQGEVVFESEDSGELEIGEEHPYTCEVRGVVCPTGTYTITVKFLDEVILATDFIVGQRDVSGFFKVSQLMLHTSRKSAAKTTVADSMAELESMIGLGSIKKQLRKQIAKIQLEQLRKKQGLPIKAQQLHMTFLGNPGTGKTTVARLLGQIYKNIGVLSKGQVIFESRSTLMTHSWGSEGELVNTAIEKAQGGILFIDEAYDLVTDHPTDPGKLIISALLQAMSDESRRDFMVIFAGYTMPMEKLLSKNPGLRSRSTSLYFSDYKVPELMQIADLWLGKNCYKLTPDARKHFESIVTSAYAHRDEHFGNARYVVNLLEAEVQPAMAERIMAGDTENAPFNLLTTIEACDIPNYNAEKDGTGEVIARLDKMVGLGELKHQIRTHLSYIRFIQARRDNKIDTPIPPLHMVFTGNPGTGKTSVAEYLGDIYRSMGILSVGNVIKITRADMIDKYIGGTEEKMKNILTAAHGNILFIDEAYTLFSKSDKDTGKNAIEVLLDTMGKENTDMIVIMAGYPKEMEELLTINPGLKGRFPYTFNFEDYDEDELFEIAQGVVERNSLVLTDGAAEAIKAVIRKECKLKDSNFSNARFVVRLITTQVLPNMALRLEGETDPKRLKRVYQRDIPIEQKEIRMINENLFDEEMIEAALKRLDAMVGLSKVKTALHEFVDFARAFNRKDPTQIERYPLKWSFVGNTGTGKSSVAEILSEILKAMHLLGKGHTVEVKAEELYSVNTSKADELLQKRMRESLQGLLFVDGDAPQSPVMSHLFNPDYLRICLATNTNEIRGRFAVVIAERDSPAIGLAKSLNKIGISNFNHTLIFDDYTAEELMQILSSQLQKYDLHLGVAAAAIMSGYIERLCAEHQTENSANARTMKDFARTIRNLASASGCESSTISAEVVARFSTLQSPRTKIGF